MKNENDAVDENFEAYLREFRPDKDLRRQVRHRIATPGRRVKFLPFAAAAALAAAVLLVILIIPKSQPIIEEVAVAPGASTVIEEFDPGAVQTLPVHVMVQYKTLNMAAANGPEALDELLEESSSRLLSHTTHDKEIRYSEFLFGRSAL